MDRTASLAVFNLDLQSHGTDIHVLDLEPEKFSGMLSKAERQLGHVAGRRITLSQRLEKGFDLLGREPPLALVLHLGHDEAGLHAQRIDARLHAGTRAVVHRPTHMGENMLDRAGAGPLLKRIPLYLVRAWSVPGRHRRSAARCASCIGSLRRQHTCRPRGRFRCTPQGLHRRSSPWFYAAWGTRREGRGEHLHTLSVTPSLARPTRCHLSLL